MDSGNESARNCDPFQLNLDYFREMANFQELSPLCALSAVPDVFVLPHFLSKVASDLRHARFGT
jgi:hypothetical protein